MTKDRGELRETAAQPVPPPRAVPLFARCHLLAGTLACIGSGFFTVGSVFALTVGLECDPLGSMRLALWGREVPGRLDKIERTRYEENDERVCRFSFSFQLPDGTPQQGTSYWPGDTLQGPRGRAPAVPGMAVTVRYDPVNPRIGRIVGTRTDMCAHWVVSVFIFPTVGAAMLLVSLAKGRQRIWLMRWGHATQVALTVCHARGSEDQVDRPVAEFKQHWHEQLRSAELLVTGLGPLRLAIAGFVHFWNWSILAFTILGVLLCLAAVGSLLLNFPIPLNAPPNIQLLGTGACVAFLIASWAMLLFMLQHTSPNRSPPPGAPPADSDPPSQGGAPYPDIPNVDCAFSFRLPNDQAVEGRDTVTLTGPPHENPRQVALFDPENPRRVMLVSSLLPGIWFGPSGEWETSVGLGELAKLAALIILCLGGLIVGLAVHITGL